MQQQRLGERHGERHGLAARFVDLGACVTKRRRHQLQRLGLVVHHEHRDTQRQEKAADPARFIPERKKASSPPVGRTASRPMPSGQDAPLGVVEFKEVQVRAIDPKTLAAVRASRRCVPQACAPHNPY